MAEQRDLKVFISWSGDLSKAVAVALRDWLPILFDRVKPWASDVDIAAGQRGLGQIESELTGAEFGVVLVTAENQNAPWINFEAGALSKTIAGDAEHRVVPLLIDLAGPTQLTGPLYQFQAEVADRDGVLSLLRSLAEVAGIEGRILEQRFAAQWPALEAKIAAAKADADDGQPKEEPRPQAEVLDEILLHVRQLRQDADAAAAHARKAATLNRALDRVAAPDAETLARRRQKNFEAQADNIAKRFGLQIALTRARPDDGLVEVTVAPVTGDLVDADVSAFETALRERTRGAEVVVDAVPF